MISGGTKKMVAGRLLSMLLMLQSKGRVTAQALADEFEVSVRTIYRDIDQLSAAGVPVYADRGPGGGFALLDGYRTRLTGMSEAEVETLSIAGLPDVAAELGLSAKLQAAQLKLEASLPKASPASSRIGSRLHIDPVHWFHRPTSVPYLPEIALAVWEQSRLSLQYIRGIAKVERTIEPLGLVLKGGDWYVVAHSKAHVRIYKIANISRLTTLDQKFERPPDFNLRDEWFTAVARFEAGLLTELATLRVNCDGASRLHLLGAAALAKAKYGSMSADGWIEVTLPVERVDSAAKQIFSFGPNVQVIAPAELGMEVRRLAEAVAALYPP
jgi:predicted DNA-binding transcriptional regulator YafY